MHTCDNPPCWNPAHLIAGTALENNRDKAAKGRQAKGEAIRRYKLTEESVRDIRARRASGESYASIAAVHKVSLATVWVVAARRTWKHVE